MKRQLGLLPAETEERIAALVAECSRRADIAHNMDHVVCVVGLAKRIGAEEGANLRVVIPSAYLHDLAVTPGKFGLPQAQRPTRAVDSLLRDLDFTREELSQVKHSIRCASYYSMLQGIQPKTLEAKVVRDADFLESMGARGIARTFVTCGWYRTREMGRLIWDPAHPPRLELSQPGPDPSPIYHFFSKLLWLKDHLLTDAARRLAIGRHEFLITFLKRYRAETEDAES
jgi:uncharacterized protein